jgi:hypothetical protein
MDHPFPVGLQVVLYAASAAIVVFVAVVIPLLFQLRGQLERFVSSVEHLEAETKPLARETRDLIDTLRELSERAKDRWPAEMGFRLLRTGVGTFVRALWNRHRDHQQKARAV